VFYDLPGTLLGVVDLTGVPAGTIATLYFDLLGFPGVQSRIVIDDVQFVGAEAPPITLALDPLSDSGVTGDDVTNLSTVVLIGTTDPQQQVLLDVDGDGFDDGSVIADATFRFDNVSLTAGVNTLLFQATNPAGASQTGRDSTPWSSLKKIVTVEPCHWANEHGPYFRTINAARTGRWSNRIAPNLGRGNVWWPIWANSMKPVGWASNRRSK
jgi:hypothetical protein